MPSVGNATERRFSVCVLSEVSFGLHPVFEYELWRSPEVSLLAIIKLC
jgi:hypothetical protein